MKTSRDAFEVEHLPTRMSVATPATRVVASRRGGRCDRVSSRLPGPHGRPVVNTNAASSSPSTTSSSIWGRLGERRLFGDIRVSEACLGPACWASTRGLDERDAHDRLSTGFEVDVNFVDAGTPPDEVRRDARLGRWIKQSGGRREDLVVAGHVPRSAFSAYDSESNTNGGTQARQLITPRQAYRRVDDSIDRLLLSNAVEHVDVLHVPWPECAPGVFRSANDKSESSAVDSLLALDALEWHQTHPSGIYLPESKGLLQFTASECTEYASSKAIRDAHRSALLDAVKSGKVRALVASFANPWLACALDLGDCAFYDRDELVEKQGADSSTGKQCNTYYNNQYVGDFIAGVSSPVSGLRDPRRVNRLDDFEKTLTEKCSPGTENKPVIARDVFWGFENERDSYGPQKKLSKVLLQAAGNYGEYTLTDLALCLARAKGFVASVSLDTGGPIGSSSSNVVLDDDEFETRLVSFSKLDNEFDPECLQAVESAQLKHFKGASNAERGAGKGRGRGRDPFQETGNDVDNED